MNKYKKFKAINRLIKRSDQIFIMGHKDLDLDAIGSALACYQCALRFKKQAYILLNDEKNEAGVQKILDIVGDTVHFISSSKVSSLLTPKSLLMIVDVNKASIMQDGNIIDQFSNVLVIDHHAKNEQTISSNLELICPETSSTSEIITEFLYYFNYQIPDVYATFLLSGITLDTNDFSIKTTATTHYAAYYLISHGASVKEVHKIMKQDIEEYILRQKVITDVEIINGTVAFAKGSNRVFYKKEELAKIADTLLEFDKIETSYVIGKLSDTEIGVSARSVGNINIGEVLSMLGGGGDQHDAAARFENKSIKEVEEILKKVLGEI